MALWPVVNPGTSRSWSRTTPPITTDGSSVSPAPLSHSASPPLIRSLMELPDPGSAAAAAAFLYFILTSSQAQRNRARASPELLETASSANGAAAGSRSGGRRVWAPVQHVSAAWLGTSLHHLVQLLSQLCRGTSARNWPCLYACTPLRPPFAGPSLPSPPSPPSPPSLWELGAQSWVCC